MNPLAGLSALAGALYLAARVRGLGRPLEDQHTEPKLSGVQEEHQTNADTFVTMAVSLVERARFQAMTNDCARARKFLDGAHASISNAQAHLGAMPHTAKRVALSRTLEAAKDDFYRVQRLVEEKCIMGTT
jgi:hypothetical protein